MIVFFLTLIPTIIISASTVPDYILMEPLPGMEEGTAPGLGSYLSNMFKILIGVAGVLAVVVITVGGVQYMTTDAISGKEGGKEKINSAIFGLILALSSVLLLQTIDPAFKNSSMTLPEVPGPSPTSGPPPSGNYFGKCYPNNTQPAFKTCYGSSLEICTANCKEVCPRTQPLVSGSFPCTDNGEIQSDGITKFANCKKASITDKSFQCGQGTTDRASCESACQTTCNVLPAYEVCEEK